MSENEDVNLKDLFENGKLKDGKESILRNKVYKKLENLDSTEEIDSKQIIELINKIRSSDYDECNKNKNKFLLDLISNKMNKDDVYRFVYELVQNSDDCTYEGEAAIEFKVNIDQNEVIVSYNEKGFRVKDIVAITDFGGSTKNKLKSIENQDKMTKIDESEDLQLIGEKGIGFKTIFRMVEEVEIHSNSYHFRLTSEKPTLPEWVDNLEDKKGTILKLKFKNKKDENDKNYAAQFFEALQERFHSKDEKLFTENPILFTRKLKKITVSNSSENSFIIAIKEKYNSNIIEIYNEDTEDGVKPKVIAFKYSKEVTMTEDAYKSRYYDNAVPDESKRKYTISILAPIGNDIKKGKLYSFLPTGIEFDAPIVIDAPFKLTTDRGGVEITEAKVWNEELINAIFLNDDSLLCEFYKNMANKSMNNEDLKDLNILNYIIPLADKNITDVTMSDNLIMKLYYGLLTEEDKTTIYNNIKNLPIIKIYNEDELKKLSNTLFFEDELGYDFPYPKELVCNSPITEINNKYLGDKRYVKKYEKVIESLITKFKWEDCVETTVNSNEINESVLGFLNANYDHLLNKKIKFDRLKIYPKLEKEKEEYLDCLEGNEYIWIEAVEGKESFSNYVILNKDILSEEDYPKLFEFHKGKIKETEKWINEIVTEIKNGKLRIDCDYELRDENIEKLKALNYFTFNEKKQAIEWDCRENDRPSKSFNEYCFEENCFTKFGDCKFIDKDLEFCQEFYKKIGFRQSYDFFIFDTDYIKLDECSEKMICKCENTEVIKEIKKEYDKIEKKLEQEKKPLLIKFNSNIPLEVKKYIINNNILSGDPLKDFCKGCFYDEVEKDGYDEKLLIISLSKIDSDNNFKNKEIKINLNIAIEFHEEVNSIMKTHKLSNFEIIIDKNVSKYEDEAMKSAISYLQSENEKTYETVCKEYLAIEEGFYKIDLDDLDKNIEFIYDSKKALLNSKKTSDCLVSFVDQQMSDKRKSEYKAFKSVLEWFSRRETVKSYCDRVLNNENDRKSYIENLNILRKEQSEAIKELNIMELINDSKSNAKDYILREVFQNINDCRHTKDHDRCVKIYVEREVGTEQLIFEYDEDGFSAKDIYSITSLGESTKHDAEEGEKGIGFKTIFNLFNSVKIYSNGFKFKIEKNNPLVPIWIDEDVPLSENKTKMIFEISKNENVGSLEDIENELDQAFETYDLFLFLENISCYEYKGSTLTKSEFEKKYYYEKEKLFDDDSIDSNTNIESVKTRKKLKDKSDEEIKTYLNKLHISVYIPKEINEKNKSGGVYSTLPTDLKFGSPIYINMPLELTTGRDDNLENEYNKKIFERIFKDNDNDCVFNKIMNKLAQTINLENKCLLPYLTKKYSESEKRLLNIDLSENSKNIKFLKVYGTDELVSINEGYTLIAPLYEFIERFDEGFDIVKEYINSSIGLQSCYIVENIELIAEVNEFAKYLGNQSYPVSVDFLEFLEEKKFYTKDKIVDLNNEKFKYLKDVIIPYIIEKNTLKKTISIYPYKSSKKEVRLSDLSGEWYYIEKDKSEYKDFYSNEKYKIIDEEILGNDFNNIKINSLIGENSIKEFNSKVIIDAYLEDMSQETDYNENWWTAARGLYKIWKNENDGFRDATKGITDSNKFYFKENYLDAEQKTFLLNLNIVSDIMNGVSFDKEEKDFDEFLERLGVKTKFSWIDKRIDNWLFNDWTIDLIGKIKSFEDEEDKTDKDKQNLYRLIHKFVFENEEIKKVNQECLKYSEESGRRWELPVLCKDKKYRILKNENKVLFFIGPEEEFSSNEENKKKLETFIEKYKYMIIDNDKIELYKDYFDSSDCKDTAYNCINKEFGEKFELHLDGCEKENFDVIEQELDFWESLRELQNICGCIDFNVEKHIVEDIFKIYCKLDEKRYEDVLRNIISRQDNELVYKYIVEQDTEKNFPLFKKIIEFILACEKIECEEEINIIDNIYYDLVPLGYEYAKFIFKKIEELNKKYMDDKVGVGCKEYLRKFLLGIYEYYECWKEKEYYKEIITKFLVETAYDYAKEDKVDDFYYSGNIEIDSSLKCEAFNKYSDELDEVYKKFKKVDSKFKFVLTEENEDNHKTDIEEMVSYIKYEIMDLDKYKANKGEIDEFLDNIVIYNTNKFDNGKRRYIRIYKKVSESEPQNVLVLIRVGNENALRCCRNCIVSFLDNEYQIKLDKREFTMTAIDNTLAHSVSEINQDDFNTLKKELNLNWEEKDIEGKKRLLMEPYYYGEKILQGYGRTCPLCKKTIITEISTMIIKSVSITYDEGKRMKNILCCKACADMFHYCEKEPDIKGMEKIAEIDSELTLEFFISPNYIDDPYSITFKPRPLHRLHLLNLTKTENEKEE